MTKFLAIAASAMMLAAAPFAVAPASAASVNIQVGGGHHGGHHGYNGRRHVERRAIHRERCTMKTVVTHRHGQRVVRKIRTCG